MESNIDAATLALARKRSFIPDKPTALLWQSAIRAHDEEHDAEQSLRFFRQMSVESSRISFNIASVHMSEKKYEESVQEYTKALSRDSHLAVALYQRAICNHNLGSNDQDEDALQDFIECHKLLRGNLQIDYRPLGLELVLWEYQVLFNIAVIYVQLGLNRHSSQYYEKARLSHLRARTSDLAKGANVEARLPTTQSMEQCTCGNPTFLSYNKPSEETCSLFQFTSTPLFHPRGLSTIYIENTEKQKFLGTSRLLFSVNHGDIYRKSSTGFAGAAAKTEGNPMFVKKHRNHKPHSTIACLIQSTLFATKIPLVGRPTSNRNYLAPA